MDPIVKYFTYYYDREEIVCKEVEKNFYDFFMWVLYI